MAHSAAPLPRDEAGTLGQAMAEVLRVALPLMISTGTFSLVLFADRTLLLRFDGASMSASMAAGNLFWTLVCLPVGVASMTGAIVGQYVGAGRERDIGRFLWQATWFALGTVVPLGVIGYYAESLFLWTGQPPDLVPHEARYLRMLMLGAAGVVLETALSGFFSGTQRTSVIMWVSVAAGVLNVGLDVLLIFGFGALPALGIAGAGIASSIAFWFKAACYATLILAPRHEARYRVWGGRGWDRPMLGKLLFFGLPAGLMYVTEAGGFAAIVLRIGRLGDLPLRATTMAINFNLIAFVPLVGVSIAASVLVARHLLESGPRRAVRSVIAAWLIGWTYSGAWAVAYLVAADPMLDLYRLQDPTDESLAAIEIARDLLGFVAIYVILDATQLITAGALRGAGDTWFVLLAGFGVSAFAILLGIWGEPDENGLRWWWWVVTLWVWLLAAAMLGRFLQGRWKRMRMVESPADASPGAPAMGDVFGR